MPIHTLNRPPYYAPDAVATKRGWEHPTTGEIYAAIPRLNSKAGAAEVLSIEFDEEAYTNGGELEVTVKFSEKVNVTAGATIVVTFDGTAGNQTVYAAAQSAVGEVVFNKQSDNSTDYVLPANVAATSTLTLTDNPADTETVVIGGKTYTFQTSLTNVDGNVLRGADASASLDNLIAAINLAAGGGTTYAAATTVHPTVTAAAGTGDTMVITAKVAGTGGNAITVTETLTNGSWSGAGTMAGGVTQTGTLSIGAQTLGGTILDANQTVKAVGTFTLTGQPANNETVVIDGKTYTFKTTLSNTDGFVKIGSTAQDSLDNLCNAIILGPGAGTDYAAATTLHSTVEAVRSAGLVLSVRAKTAGTAGNSLATTDTVTEGDWGGATLASGSAGTASTKTVSAGVGEAAGEIEVA